MNEQPCSNIIKKHKIDRKSNKLLNLNAIDNLFKSLNIRFATGTSLYNLIFFSCGLGTRH